MGLLTVICLLLGIVAWLTILYTVYLIAKSKFKQKKDMIFCLIGESGCGKTTIAKHLSEQGYNVIQSYTTRPKRTENEWGHTHIKNADIPMVKKNVIAETFYNDHYYFATKAQYRGKGISIYSIDPRGYERLIDRVKVPVYAIYIKTSFEMRKNRVLAESNFKYTFDGIIKISHRIARDLFQYKSFRVDYVVNNDDSISETLAAVEDIIESFKD